MKKELAFTLSEVLITLGIIGVVAAITIPAIMTKYTEIRTVNQLKADQSILSQAIKLSEEEHGNVDGWGLTGANEASAKIIAEKLKPSLKIAIDCGTHDKDGFCVTKKTYKQLNGTNHGEYAITRRDTYKITLMNGSSVWWKGPQDSFRIITFWVDVNGNKQPNTYGKDLFVFSYENGGIRPLGAPNSASPYTKSCTKNGNGWGCAYYILLNGNMNYLH